MSAFAESNRSGVYIVYRFGSELASVSRLRPCSESRSGGRCVVMKSLMPFCRGWMFFEGRFAWFTLGFLLSLLF